MLVLALGLIWAGYGISSYGYVLVKGWDISLREWFSPLNPYQWPGGGAAPPTVPLGQVWPSGQQAAGGGGHDLGRGHKTSGPPTGGGGRPRT